MTTTESVFSDLCRRIRQNDCSTRSVTINGADEGRANTLYECLESNTQIRRLGLDFTAELPVSRSLLEYLGSSPHLRIVDLFGIDMTKTATCTVLLILLKGVSKNPTIKELTLHGTQMKKSIFERVASVFSPVSSASFIMQSGIASSFQQMKFLESLWLEHLDAVVLAQLLPSLRHLLRLNTLTLVPVEQESVNLFAAVGGLITTSHSLRCLVLYDCSLTKQSMQPLAEAIQHSGTFTHLALHTSRIDPEAINIIQELYVGYLTGITVGLDVALAEPISEIVLSENSTLLTLDMQFAAEDERKRVLSNITGKTDQLETFIKFLLHNVTGVVEDIPKREVQGLEELTWATIRTEEELVSMEAALSVMTGLKKFFVDIADKLDPVGLLRACKEGSVEVCTINGQRYDLKPRSVDKKNAARKGKRSRRRKSRQSVADGVNNVDGVGLELSQIDAIDTMCAPITKGEYDGDLESDIEASCFYGDGNKELDPPPRGNSSSQSVSNRRQRKSRTRSFGLEKRRSSRRDLKGADGASFWPMDEKPTYWQGQDQEDDESYRSRASGGSRDSAFDTKSVRSYGSRHSRSRPRRDKRRSKQSSSSAAKFPDTIPTTPPTFDTASNSSSTIDIDFADVVSKFNNGQ